MKLSVWENQLTKRAARTDAHHGQHSIEERIIQAQGLQPNLDPIQNLEHGELLRTFVYVTRINELREDRTRLLDSASGKAPMFWLIAGLILAVAVESLSGIWILQAMGTEPKSRWLFGIGLAITLIGITAVTAHVTTARMPERGPDDGERGRAHKRSKWALIIIVAYATFVAAIMIVRVQNSIDEETSSIVAVGNAILTLGLSIGPAWFAESIIRKFAASKTTRDRIRNIRRELRDAERAHKQARAAVIHIIRERDKWADEAARRRALYVTQHRLESAKVKS
jgi:hypothetical protein